MCSVYPVVVLKLSYDIIKVLYWFFFAFNHKPARGKIAKKKVTSSLPCSWGRIRNLRQLLTVNLCLGFSDLVSDLPYDIMKAPNQKFCMCGHKPVFGRYRKLNKNKGARGVPS